MKMSGSYDVGCGTYKYSIKPASTTSAPSPPSPTAGPASPSLTTVTPSVPTAATSCYSASEGCKFWDVKPETAHRVTDTFCNDHASMNGQLDNWPAIQDASNPFIERNSYNFKVLWKPNCVSTFGKTMNLGQPIPNYSCKQAMRDTFDKCEFGVLSPLRRSYRQSANIEQATTVVVGDASTSVAWNIILTPSIKNLSGRRATVRIFLLPGGDGVVK